MHNPISSVVFNIKKESGSNSKLQRHQISEKITPDTIPRFPFPPENAPAAHPPSAIAIHAAIRSVSTGTKLICIKYASSNAAADVVITAAKSGTTTFRICTALPFCFN